MDRPRGELWRARASEQGSLFQAQTVGVISLDRAREGSGPRSHRHASPHNNELILIPNN